MFKRKKALSVFLVTALLTSILLVSGTTQEVSAAAGDPVTMAVIGDKQILNGTVGDTWDTAWLSNGKVLVQHNDGYGFNNSTLFKNNGLDELLGTPEDMSQNGINLNYGSLANNLVQCYSSGIYEVDGALYQNISAGDGWSSGIWQSYKSLMKSTDGGANWINHLGQRNTLPPTDYNYSMYPDVHWGLNTFIKYGQGGSAPDVDNAQEYVYIYSEDCSKSNLSVPPADRICVGDFYLLSRISRADLQAWDDTFDGTVEFYTGGDGMLDENWSSDISESEPIYENPANCAIGGITYNYALGRYIMTNNISMGYGPVENQTDSKTMILEAPHPWGPWTPVLDEAGMYKMDDNMAWPYFLPNKFTSGDGKKMWMIMSGSGEVLPKKYYGIHFVPLYLSTSAVSVYEAENTTLSGTSTSTSIAGYSGSGYVTGFDAIGDNCQFTVNTSTAGEYLFKFRYNTGVHQNISLYVNGNKIRQLRLGKSEQYYSTWTDYGFKTSLNSGSNTIKFQYDSGDSGNFNLDKLSLAFYAASESAFETIQGESWDGQSGVTVADGIISAGYIENGDWVKYSNIDFGTGATGFKANVASATSGGTIEIWVDGLNGTKIGQLNVTGTGQWGKYDVQNASVTSISGVHDLYLKFTGGDGGYLFDIDWFKFFSGIHTDEFNSSTLDTAWGWAREDNTKWSLTAAPGSMRISCQPGEIYLTGTDAKNILLRSIPSGNWDIYTKLNFNPGPASNYQQAGLIVYKDDNNYLKLDRIYTTAFGTPYNRIYCAREVNGAYTDGPNTGLSDNLVWMRINKNGTTYTFYYNTDGSTNWTQLGQLTADLGSNIRVGLHCFSGATGPNADFDWFDIRTHTDDFSSSTLDSAWSWVREDNTKWSLMAVAGSMRIGCQPGEIYLTGTDAKNILLRNASSANWNIYTKLNFNPGPASNYQQAGLIAYKDDDNYLKLDRIYTTAFGTPYNRIYCAREVNGAYTDGPSTGLSNNLVWMRINKNGTTYTFYYNTDGGSNWTQLGQLTADLGSTIKVGLHCFSGAAGPNADFDWFDMN